jgi:hypothetical protein
MKKRRVRWPLGNPAFAAWEADSPAGRLVLRRNHELVRTGERLCQGWDLWLDGEFVGANGSRILEELAAFSYEELRRVARPACCGRHRNFQQESAATPPGKGGRRPNAGRRPLGAARRVGLNTTVKNQTLELIDERRGTRSRGRYLDDLLGGREPLPPAEQPS